jgi:EAL domain-containing protein (putative c-di-GMP-specific phosphodiesterase class I)/CHASE2 domain-containing sensor protein
MQGKSKQVQAGSYRLLPSAMHQAAIFAAAVLVSVLTALLGTAEPAERFFGEIRDDLNSKPASGEIYLVEIDARSLKRLDNWPWPRRYHAQLVDRLNEAGVEQIVFDIDFSSRSTDAEDTAFAQALARAQGKVVLPTFRQTASAGASEASYENLPIGILRDQAFLGSVNVHAGRNGQVNTYPFGSVTDGVPRPSIGALLAEASGEVTSVFELDHSIEISTIPAYSFIDIIEGRFDAASFKGKRVIVGATAIEMGDRYETARFGIVPGVLVQALAAETLMAGTALAHWGPWPLLLLAVSLIAVFSRFQGRASWDKEAVTLLLVLMIFVLSVAAERYRFAHLDLAPAVLFIGIWMAGQYLIGFLKRLARERYFDAATGHPNLAAWLRQKGTGQPVYVVVAEVANFGEILSILGEEESARFVGAVAQRFEFICGDVELYRIGRNQFCWRMESESREALDIQIAAAGQIFNSPLQVGGRSVRATLCFGLVEGQLSDPLGLSSKAVLAAQQASRTGVRSLWHSESLADDTSQSLFIVSEFANALDAGELSVVYQPKFSLAADRVTGAEALVRWNSPTVGPISPAVFVPVLERENLIEPLTLFVLRRVLASLEEWQAAGCNLSCAVNISALLLGRESFVDAALDIVRSGRADASLLTFELTETAVMTSPDIAAASIARFAELGIHLSIDDFGTGQSTLSYLKDFTASEIKIDQSFIRLIASNNANRIMVRSTIEMAHALGIRVVAEGVEDDISLRILKEFGCDVIQGWHIGRPLTKEAFFEAWVKGRTDGPENKAETAAA